MSPANTEGGSQVRTGLPYKVYIAKLSQESNSDPTVDIVLQNTLGLIVWTRTGVGVYTGTLAGAFPDISKVAIYTSPDPTSKGGPHSLQPTLGQITADSVEISSFSPNTTAADSQMVTDLIEIRVYP